MHSEEHDHENSGHGHSAESEQAAIRDLRAEANVRHEKVREHKEREVYKNMGDALDWHNTTSDPNKIADVEILTVTGYNVEFLQTHHRVRDLIEANARWGEDLFTAVGSPGEPEEIYKRLAGGMPMPVQLLNEDKKPTGIVKDLRDMAQLLRIEEYNEYLGDQKIPLVSKLDPNDPERKKTIPGLRERFLSGDHLVVMVKRKEKIERDGKEFEVETVTTVDLREECPKDDLKDFDFAKYLQVIDKEQIGFQRLGNTRDAALKGHHVENGSHTMFIKTGRIKANGNPEYMWMPVSGTLAMNDARADLPKTGVGFRAEGHVHEIARGYNEDTGTTVAVNVDLLRRHRGDVQYKDHSRTNVRMNHAAVGMGAKEEMLILSGKTISVERGGKTVDFSGKVAVIGGNRTGKIYEGLHHTYDAIMKKMRGFELTSQEADDLIFTDIIAPWIYANSSDWLMCFANSTNGLNYIPSKAMLKGGDRWNQYGGSGGENFCVAIPCRQEDADDKEKGLKYFFEYNELIDYVNKRIKEGDIKDVRQASQVSRFKGLTEKEIQRDDEEGDLERDDEKNQIDDMKLEEMRAMKNLLPKLFGIDHEVVWKDFVEKGKDGIVTIAGKPEKFIDYVAERLRTENFDEVKVITGKPDKDEGQKALLLIFRRMTDDLKRRIFEYDLTTDVMPEKGPKSQLDKVTIAKIDTTEVRTADWVVAANRCWKFVGDKPGFAGFFTRKDKKEMVLTDEKDFDAAKATVYGELIGRVAKIITAQRTNPDVKKAIVDSKVRDPRWLLREAAIQIGKPELLKELKVKV